MLIEIITFSLTALSGIPAITVQTYFWTQQSPPQVAQKPLEQKQEVLSETTSTSPTPTTIPTEEPTPTPTPTPTETPTPTPEPTDASPTDLESLFTKYADEYHVDKELLKRIAACESGFNTQANFNNLYVGMFQFSEGAWTTVRSSMGLSTDQELRKNAEESIRSAAFMLSRGQENAWPSCK